MSFKRYRGTAHRLRPPEETFALVSPHLKGLGITRVADLTGLDRLDIPVYCAFTPDDPMLQAAWGKGAAATDAAVSACMEAVERRHILFSDSRERWATASALQREGAAVISPRRLQRFQEGVHFTEETPLAWLPAETPDPADQEPAVYLPAAAVYPREPRVNLFSANGLASGNCPEEAQLHALFEIIERHGISSCFDAKGRLGLKNDGVRRMDLSGCGVESVARLREHIHGAGADLVLLKPESRIDGVHLFWAVIIDGDAPLPWIRVNMGYGAHLSPEVGAVRAITEAAQSRMAYLHGCREDMGHKMRLPRPKVIEKTIRYFSSFSPETPWHALDDRSAATLDEDLQGLMKRVVSAGFTRIYRVRIPCRIEGFAIVKLVVEGMALRHGLF